ncbi:MAG: DivIVA domain-containing protein [candidate division Zixibacteria bacterium]|nr:DivIVA domain-containing protein [candidate division Zixibacteria bacterium]
MNIKPVDIRHQEFKKSFRGFDIVEVEQYLNQIADNFEEILSENEKLKNLSNELKAKLESYTNIENAISQTLVDTKKTAENIIQNAKQEAEIIVKKSQNDADDIILKASEKAVKIRQDMHDLENRKAALVAELRSLLQTHLQMLERIDSDSSISHVDTSPKSRLTDDDIERIAGKFTAEPESEDS